MLGQEQKQGPGEAVKVVVILVRAHQVASTQVGK